MVWTAVRIGLLAVTRALSLRITRRLEKYKSDNLMQLGTRVLLADVYSQQLTAQRHLRQHLR